MRDERSELLAAMNCRLVRVRDRVENGDAVKADHLLKVNVSALVAVDVWDRETVILQGQEEVSVNQVCQP